MSDINDRHVVPHTEGGWDVKAPNAERASSHHDTQAEAIDRAREIIANAGGGELVTHGTDGRIRESDTVAAARADTQQVVDAPDTMPQVVEQPPVVVGVDPPLAPPTIALVDPVPTEPAPPIRPVEPSEHEDSKSSEREESTSNEHEDEDSKPTLGDRVKNLLHLSSD